MPVQGWSKRWLLLFWGCYRPTGLVRQNVHVWNFSPVGSFQVCSGLWISPKVFFAQVCPSFLFLYYILFVQRRRSSMGWNSARGHWYRRCLAFHFPTRRLAHSKLHSLNQNCIHAHGSWRKVRWWLWLIFLKHNRLNCGIDMVFAFKRNGGGCLRLSH